jgi:hypothetical protein
MAIDKTAAALLGTPDRPYHRGARRQALIEAAEHILERDGIKGLALRRAAGEAGGNFSGACAGSEEPPGAPMGAPRRSPSWEPHSPALF